MGIVVRDSDGKPVRITGVNMDITVQRDTERRLAQAQRMESIAQLSAGVAHDFNNILGTVKASLQLVARHRAIATDARALERIMRAVDAIDRGASLSQRLLAYSSRQHPVSERIDVAALLTGMTGLLRRTVGNGIVVELELAPELPGVKTDASQLENAIVNLALNARDAMPHGGRLAIRVDRAVVGAGDDGGRSASAPDGQSWVADGKSIPSGEYLRITVTDNGRGMTQSVRARAFEPFFTTRQTGEATGPG
ncbi:MAG: ATP-binding protein [Gammaproteobacteria bacterium]|nr:ATP-binding protein [Gammaproteobacteria bacterium]